MNNPDFPQIKPMTKSEHACLLGIGGLIFLGCLVLMDSFNPKEPSMHHHPTLDLDTQPPRSYLEAKAEGEAVAARLDEARQKEQAELDEVDGDFQRAVERNTVKTTEKHNK